MGEEQESGIIIQLSPPCDTEMSLTANCTDLSYLRSSITPHDIEITAPGGRVSTLQKGIRSKEIVLAALQTEIAALVTPSSHFPGSLRAKYCLKLEN